MTFSEAVRSNPFAKAALEMLQRSPPKPFSNSLASPNSKVLLALMMQEFSRRVQGTPSASITFNGADPGPTRTDNVNQLGPIIGALAKRLSPLFMREVAQGAAVLVWLATSPEVEGKTAKTFNHKLQEVKLSARCTDPALAARAWSVTEEVLALAASR